MPAPALYASDNTACLTQDLDGAKALLDDAGWVDSDGDGVRDKDGVKLSILYQTSTNAVRQDFQALIKDWWSQIGVETELRNLDASVFFGGDPGSPDTFQKFYADVEMYANTFNGTDPAAYLAAYRCGASQSHPASGRVKTSTASVIQHMTRCSTSWPTGDLDKRGEIARKMNDMVPKTHTIVPLVNRARVRRMQHSLVALS